MERKWWTLITVSTGIFMLLLDITIVNVALPNIQKELHASLSGLQWVIDAYALTLGALLLTAGSLGDLLGRKKVFGVGVVIFTLGSLLCGVATSALFLSLARAGQGIGGAIMFATSLALIAHSFHGRDRGVAFGIWGAITGVAVAVGPVVGGALTSGLSWRWIFYVNIPIGVVLFLWPLPKIEESRDPDAPTPDWAGFVTFSAGLAALVFGLIRSNANGWGSFTVAGSLIAAAVLLTIFVFIERRLRQPMFDLRLLRKPTFGGGLIAAFGISASIFSVLTYLILYMQNILGFSAIGTGVRFLALTGAIFLTAGIAGRLTAKVSTRFLIGPGFVLIGIGLLLMRGLNQGTHWTHLLPGLLISGVGAGFVNVPLASTAVGVVETKRAGMASGINLTFRQIGIATGIAGLGSLFASQVRAGVMTHLAGTTLEAKAHTIAHAISIGSPQSAIASVPPQFRQAVGGAAKAGFVQGLNHVLLVSAFIAFGSALAALTLIRKKDFVVSHAPEATVA